MKTRILEDMKKTISVLVALVATFVLSGDAFSTGDNVSPMGEQSYCAYDDLTGVCKMRNKGVACYMVFADCTFVEN